MDTMMTLDQARMILATGQGDVATAFQVYYGHFSAAAVPVPPPAAPPVPYQIQPVVSNDPAVFSTDAYSKTLNLSSFKQQANWENTRRYDNYLNGYNNWKLNGAQGNPPVAPAYEVVDDAGFEAWWAQVKANLVAGVDAPDISSFVSNAPKVPAAS